MKKLNFITACVLLSSAMYAQQPPVKISWAGELNCEYYPLDSVIVTNKATGEKVVFYYPDTSYTTYSDVAVKPVPFDAETRLKTYPNPFSDKVQAEFSLAQKGEADLAVYDVLGREIVRKVSVLERGTHVFNLSLPQGAYTLHLQTAEGKQSARLLSEAKGNPAPQIAYVSARHCGLDPQSPLIAGDSRFRGNDAEAEKYSPSFGGGRGEAKSHKSDEDFPFAYGDTLVLQGFISGDDLFQYKTEHSLILTEDAHITFDFFNYIAFIDTSEIIIIDSLKNIYGKCYYNYFYHGPYDYSDNIECVYARFIIINTQSDLDSLFACNPSLVQPVVDFSRQTLVLISGTTPNYISPPWWSFSFIRNCNGNYVIKMDIWQTPFLAIDSFNWMVIVNEVIQSKEQIKLIINYYW